MQSRRSRLWMLYPPLASHDDAQALFRLLDLPPAAPRRGGVRPLPLLHPRPYLPLPVRGELTPWLALLHGSRSPTGRLIRADLLRGSRHCMASYRAPVSGMRVRHQRAAASRRSARRGRRRLNAESVDVILDEADRWPRGSSRRSTSSATERAAPKRCRSTAPGFREAYDESAEAGPGTVFSPRPTTVARACRDWSRPRSRRCGPVPTWPLACARC